MTAILSLDGFASLPTCTSCSCGRYKAVASSLKVDVWVAYVVPTSGAWIAAACVDIELIF